VPHLVLGNEDEKIGIISSCWGPPRNIHLTSKLISTKKSKEFYLKNEQEVLSIYGNGPMLNFAKEKICDAVTPKVA
jgi:hypothetical protein